MLSLQLIQVALEAQRRGIRENFLRKMTLEQCLEDKWRGQSGAVVEEFKEMIKKGY